ncbi:nucleotidyltransferase domain-containing protein [Candidatus Parcubacteria bacterium]|nr:nucleotidyltransferase domain-containing protein [Candidatus Parcubacteria bacterium]
MNIKNSQKINLRNRTEAAAVYSSNIEGNSMDLNSFKEYKNRIKMNRPYQNKIKPLVSKIVDKYNPDKVYLFGSYAWGNPTADSDIDLFIVKNTVESQRERSRKLRSLLFGSGIPFDLLVYTPNEVKERLKMGDFFINDIIKKGEVLYERGK